MYNYGLVSNFPPIIKYSSKKMAGDIHNNSVVVYGKDNPSQILMLLLTEQKIVVYTLAGAKYWGLNTNDLPSYKSAVNMRILDKNLYSGKYGKGKEPHMVKRLIAVIPEDKEIIADVGIVELPTYATAPI